MQNKLVSSSFWDAVTFIAFLLKKTHHIKMTCVAFKKWCYIFIAC